MFEVTSDMFGKPKAPGTKIAGVFASPSEKSGFAVGTQFVWALVIRFVLLWVRVQSGAEWLLLPLAQLA